jgi:hypothetical protein
VVTTWWLVLVDALKASLFYYEGEGVVKEGSLFACEQFA